MSQLVEDFKAGKVDLITLDWSKVSKEDQEAILALVFSNGIEGGGVATPTVPGNPTKPKNRGLGNVIKYGVILGLVAGAVAIGVHFFL